jgi:pantothenate kinase-related protein Tda10
MDFNQDLDMGIFDSLLKKRPEVIVENLKRDIETYYLQYVQKLIDLKNEKSPDQGFLVGVSAIQGVGKTTQGEILEILLDHFGHSTFSQSIDDHYLTHKQLCELRQKDPRYIRRGVTHDINLALRDLKKLQTMKSGKPILISGYDKGVQSGDGDRLRWINMVPGLRIIAQVVDEELMVNKDLKQVKALKMVSANYKGQEIILLDNMGSDIPILEHFLPQALIDFLSNHTSGLVAEMTQDGKIEFKGDGEVTIEKKELPNAWRVVDKKPDFIFYDGWMLGARKFDDESVFSSGLPALEKTEDQDFAKMINQKLVEYEPFWQMFNFMNVLYVPNYQISIQWRDQAEEALRAKGAGMTHAQITEFVHYFWRSVHPAIHIKNLAHDSVHANQVTIINDDHSIKETLTPDEAKTKYP